MQIWTSPVKGEVDQRLTLTIISCAGVGVRLRDSDGLVMNSTQGPDPTLLALAKFPLQAMGVCI